MGDEYYIRALYDETREVYFIPNGDLPEGIVEIEYTLVLLDTEEPAGTLILEGAVQKSWHEQDKPGNCEFFVFQEYPDQQAFDRDIHDLLTSAKDAAYYDNVDEFLCVLDAVKERAVESGFEDESLFDFEGLFEDGPVDAYILREFDDVRLHDHVERADECWRLQIAPVVDNQNSPLGWSVFVVHFPTLSGSATQQDILTAQQGRVLELGQHPEELLARLQLKHLQLFMIDGDRVKDPEFAFVDDTVVLEWMAEGRLLEHGPHTEAAWRELSGEQLSAFLNNSSPMISSRDEWHPDDKDTITKFFEDYPQSPGREDQLRAMLSDDMGIKIQLDENSPWHELDID